MVFLALIPADLYNSVTSTTKSKSWCHPSLSVLDTPTLQSPAQGLTSRKPSLILQLADWILLLPGIQAVCLCALLFL